MLAKLSNRFSSHHAHTHNISAPKINCVNKPNILHFLSIHSFSFALALTLFPAFSGCFFALFFFRIEYWFPCDYAHPNAIYISIQFSEYPKMCYGWALFLQHIWLTVFYILNSHFFKSIKMLICIFMMETQRSRVKSEEERRKKVSENSASGWNGRTKTNTRRSA